MKHMKIQTQKEDDLCRQICGWIETDQLSRVYSEIKRNEGAIHQSVDGRTMLHVAVKHDHEGLVKHLLEHMANPARQDEEGNTALHLACTMGAYAVAYEIISSQEKQKRKRLLDEVNKKRETTLMMAARAGVSELIQLLMKEGADPHRQDEHGNTCLHIATKEGNIDAVEQIMREEPMANAPDRLGNTPLHIAAQANSKGMIRIMLKQITPVMRKNCAMQYPADLTEDKKIRGMLDMRRIKENEDSEKIQKKTTEEKAAQ